MLYKLFIKGGGLFLIALVIVTAAVSVFSGISKAKLKNENDLNLYRALISEYCGEYTEEKKAAIDRLSEEKQSVFDKIDALNERYAKDKITYEEYKAQRLALNDLLAGSDGYMLFCNRVSAAENNGVPIFDDTVWSVLFSKGIAELIVVAAVIAAAVILVLRDLELPVKLLFGTTKNGIKKIYLLNAAYIFVFSMLLGIIISIVKLATAHFSYGIEYGAFPLNGLSLFEGSKYQLSLLGGYWLFTILHSFGLAFFGGSILFAGILLRNTLYTAALGFLSVIVPSLFESSKWLLFVPAPFHLVYAARLFSGIYNDIGEKTYLSMSSIIWFSFASGVLCVCFYIAFVLIGIRREKV